METERLMDYGKRIYYEKVNARKEKAFYRSFAHETCYIKHLVAGEMNSKD